MTWNAILRRNTAALTRTILVAATLASAASITGCSGDETNNPPPPPPRDGGTDTSPPPLQTVATPQFSPGPGTFHSAQSVTITSPTAGATIRYTLDGSPPTATSPVFSSPLSIATTTTIKAIAIKTGSQDSAIQTGVYTIEAAPGAVLPVEFNPNAGTYANDQAVSLLSQTAGASICYSRDDSDPTCDETARCLGTATSYSAASPLGVSQTNATIKAIACKSGMPSSLVTSAKYTLAAAAPTFAPPSGTENPSTRVTIATVTSRGSIRYTLDGTDPTCNSADSFSQSGTFPPFAVDTTVKALTCKDDYATSEIVTATYRIRPGVPSIKPATGTYKADQRVEIVPPEGATVCYTKGLEPADPSCSGEVCTGLTELPIDVKVTGTVVKAIGCKRGNTQSNQVSATYTLKPDAPTFDPKTGTSVPAASGKLDVTISSEGAAKIAYTTDNSDPTCSGTTVPNGAKVSVGPNVTVKAIGCKDDYAPSDARQANYPKAGATSAPVFTPTGGVYAAHQNVAMASPDARICYSAGATAPDCNESTTACTAGTEYVNPVALNTKGSVLKAIACKSGLFKSTVTEQTYDFKVGDVTILPAAGNYEIGQVITFKSETEAETGVTFHGSYGDEPADPTCASPVFPSPFTVSARGKVKVVGCKDGYNASNVASADYKPVTARPTFAPPGGSYNEVQSVTLESISRKNADLPTKICYTLDGSAPGCEPSTQVCSGPGDVQGGAAPLVVAVTKSSQLRAVACVASGSYPMSAESTTDYALSVGALTFGPPQTQPLTQVLPKIDVSITHPPADPRICWSSTRSVEPAHCLGNAPPSGVHCSNAATVSLDNGGSGFDSDTTINAVACKPSHPGLTPKAGGVTYAFTPYRHTTPVDGADDFATADAFATKKSGTAFVSWDDAFVYVGVRSADIAASTNYLSVYLSGAGGVKTGLDTGVVNAPNELPFEAKYHVRWRTDGADAKVRFYNGSAWIDAPFQLAAGSDIATGGAGASSFVEFRLKRSDLGNPTIVDISGTIWNATTLDSLPAVDNGYVHLNFRSVRAAAQSILPQQAVRP